MEPRLTQTQLSKVIAEIEQLSRQREAELEPQQVREILRELNLPDELLEDALVQLQRREVLAKRQQRNRWIAIAAALTILGAIATASLVRHNQQQTLSQVTAGPDRLSLTQAGGDNLTQVDRQTNPRVYYNVTLQNAPVGGQLTLRCDWLTPNGQVVHQNNYQTRTIATPVWSTFCFYNLGSAATPGNWEVRMVLEGRVLSTQPFVVR